MNQTHTIAAVATAPLPAGVAVVRVSGPLTRHAMEQCFRSKRRAVDFPREMIFGTFQAKETKENIDTGMLVFFPGPHSFTGEDCCEFHLHGSPLITKKVLQTLYSLGLQPAKPGEFSERAFLNGKLDLAQAEAISDVIHAGSERALAIARAQFEGKLSTAISSIGEPLRDALAELEAHLDFPEEDINPATLLELKQNLLVVESKLGELLASYAYGQQVKEGLHVVLFGEPNVGKSSLLNTLLGTDRAIVTDVSGTTRDEIEESVMIHDYQVVLCDTAGITETADVVEQIGVARSHKRLQWADIVFLVVSAEQELAQLQKQVQLVQSVKKNTWLILNKSDLIRTQVLESFDGVSKVLYVSAKTGAGIEELRSELAGEIENLSVEVAESGATITSERHQRCLVRGQQAIKECLGVLDDGMSMEFVSGELRIALSALEELVGRTYTEDILGRIFSKFCIGK